MRRLVLALVVVGLGPLLAAGEDDEPSRRPLPPAPLGPGPHDVVLGELRDEPSRWLGREVRFVLQVDEPLETWNPWLTRFGPAEFVALRGWPDESFLWELDVWEDPTSRIFARRDTEVARTLQRMQRYDRLQVRAFVRAVFLDEPWLEVVEARRIPGSVGEGTLVHAGRGLARMAEGSWRIADGELQRAQLGGIPRHAFEELQRLRDRCHERLDEE